LGTEKPRPIKKKNHSLKIIRTPIFSILFMDKIFAKIFHAKIIYGERLTNDFS
jgi:hypothetical protein